jgi:CubicO group peptidase (beta-lactamase class C family)
MAAAIMISRSVSPLNAGIGTIFIFALLTAACAQPADSGDVFAPVLELHEAQENVGLALVLMKAGEVEVERYLGHALVEHDVPVSAQTRFQVMSVTKAVIGAALIKTYSAGLVDLDAAIQTYLPDYPSPENGEITLRRLAGHTAGLTHLNHPGRKAVYVEHFGSAQDSLTVFKDLPLVHEPGTAYSYSSAGYTLIAAVLEAVHEKPIQEVLDELIFEPLDLQTMAPGNVLAPTPNEARVYSYIDVWTYEPVEELQEVPTWDFSYNYGGGNLVTTANDLARFAAAFTEPGFFSVEELNMIYTKIDPEKSRWGFGWFVNETESGDKYLSISGATPGVQAGVAAYPETDIVIVAIANSWGKNSAGGNLVIDAPQAAVAAWGRQTE